MGLPTGLFLQGDVSATAESIFNLNISANLKSYLQSFKVQNRSQREKFDQKKQRIKISWDCPFWAEVCMLDGFVGNCSLDIVLWLNRFFLLIISIEDCSYKQITYLLLKTLTNRKKRNYITMWKRQPQIPSLKKEECWGTRTGLTAGGFS
jgi:hypothetical protein